MEEAKGVEKGVGIQSKRKQLGRGRDALQVGGALRFTADSTLAVGWPEAACDPTHGARLLARLSRIRADGELQPYWGCTLIA